MDKPQTETQLILDSIQLPADLRKLSIDELNTVCQELRHELIATVSRTGGHLASSLGVVELTVALHATCNTPNDSIVWDVGHQAYIHKMLTGRRSRMSGIRQYKGISGFPKRSESPYDAFGAGHAGTSISAALGMREAIDKVSSDPNTRNVLAIIGDGSMTCGMAFEALNHLGQLHKNVIVILNDNGMSIAPNVGAISRAFSKTLTGELSTIARRWFKQLVKQGYVPESLYRTLDRMEDATQGLLSTPSLLFGAFRYRYIGPVDGHSLPSLIDALNRAKRQDGPVLLHVRTIKGKGYDPAELDPVTFHGVSPFSVCDGAFQTLSNSKARSYTSVFGETIRDICKTDNRVVAITAAMPDGTGLNIVAKEFPDRVYDVGISEQHAVTFAAGLACEGLKPVVAVYSSFLQRSFDQIMHDVCLQSLPVRFAIDRSGLVGEDGPTHHGVFDFGYLRMLPNIVIMAPKDEVELQDMILTAMNYNKGPIAFRYPRGACACLPTTIKLTPHSPRIIPIGRAEIIRAPLNDSICNTRSRALIISIGKTVQTALEASQQLSAQYGIETTVVNARFVKPLDQNLLYDLIKQHPLAITVEDHAKQGGFGSAVLEFMSDTDLCSSCQLIRLGIEDKYIEHGSIQKLHRLCNIDARAIVTAIRENLTTKEIFMHQAIIGNSKISNKIPSSAKS